MQAHFLSITSYNYQFYKFIYSINSIQLDQIYIFRKSRQIQTLIEKRAFHPHQLKI